MRHAKVLVLDRDEVISCAACGLPYFLSGDLENPNKLIETPYGRIRDAEFFGLAKDIRVLTKTSVEKIDREARTVTYKSLDTGEETVHKYDKLVLATGASPIMLPGVPKDSKRIFTFRTLKDAVHLKKSLEKGEINKVGIIGGG